MNGADRPKWSDRLHWFLGRFWRVRTITIRIPVWASVQHKCYRITCDWCGAKGWHCSEGWILSVSRDGEVRKTSKCPRCTEREAVPA